MMYLYTENFQEEIQGAMEKVEGLRETVRLAPLAEIDPKSNHLIIDEDQLIAPIPWDNAEPPILFDSVPFHTSDLLAVTLCKLGYEEEALTFAKHASVREAIHCRIQLGTLDPSTGDVSFQEDTYFSLHNYAVLTHYAGHPYPGISAEKCYEKAISIAPSDEHKAFTAKHLAVYLVDNGAMEKAEQLLRHYLQIALSEAARHYLQLDLIHVLMASLPLPYTSDQGDEIKQLIWEALHYFEAQEIPWAIASLYTHASEMANFEKSYSESLGYIAKAIAIYEQGFPEFLASAYIRKGTLLYTWAQDENPQFYQPAIDTYQEALKTFTREYAPDIYAEIHHNLAVIYAEMPVDEQKRGMWSAFSATSFKECLDFYQKDTYPYEYAMVANNYANALLKYPPAKTGDNAEKAVYYYLEALEVRNADQFPIERAHTILNYLEACWQVHNINKSMESARYKDMLAKAKEVKALTTDNELIRQSQAHLDQLSALSVAIMK